MDREQGITLPRIEKLVETADHVRRRNLYELGGVISTAQNDPKKLNRLKPKDPMAPQEASARATGMLKIPRKRDHG